MKKRILLSKTLIMSVFSFVLLCGDSTHSFAVKAEILQEGQGYIDIKCPILGSKPSPWPKGYRLDGDKKITIRRISDDLIPELKPEVRQTWDPSRFTSLSQCRKGEQLDQFQFIVHGLELEHLVNGLQGISFDDFVRKILNPNAPLGDDFIPLYPFYFHQKSIVSASVISQNLSATFGKLGFILSVPEDNFLFGANKDIGSPTDIQFYENIGGLNGQLILEYNFSKYPLPKLDDLLPTIPQKAPEGIISSSASYASLSHYQNESAPNIEEELRQPFKRMGIMNPTSEQIARARKRIEPSLAFQETLFGAMTGKQTVSPTGKIEKKEISSVYNELAFVPYRPSRKSRVKISGVFLRSSEEKLASFLKTSAVRKLLDTATALELPVVTIYDGQDYETDL